MIRITDKTLNNVLSMKDSVKKLMKINDLMLRVDYVSPLWYKLDAESRRLQDNGFAFPV